jgi:hypothetical protein
VSAGHDVEDFVIHDAALADRLENSTAPRMSPEKLLLRETKDGLDVVLYLESTLVGRLMKDDPTEHLHAGNLADFLTALEGVSHFLCLVWSARHQRDVSLLELELQAEIDKFILAALLLARDRDGRVPGALHPMMFETPSFDTAVNDEWRERYSAANEYARRYCAWLQRRYLARHGERGIMSELRRFYRLGHHGKLARIRYDARH